MISYKFCVPLLNKSVKQSLELRDDFIKMDSISLIPTLYDGKDKLSCLSHKT